MAEPKDRLTVVENVYHQAISDGQGPTQFESRYSRELDTKEQVYQRRTKVGEDWEPLDFGWIEKVGLLLIRNEEGKFTEIPTDEENQRTQRKILEVAYCSEGSGWLIPVGESMRGIPTSKLARIRSHSGVTRYTITVIPA